jgi:argininosuccinate lyase
MAEPTHPLAERFTASLPVDRRLHPYDIAGSIAHCRMLARQRIIPRRDAERIVAGLESVAKELATGRFRALPGDEDIHMAIERRLIEVIGPVGGKLHTARSRNDQVALDVRLYLRETIASVRASIRGLQRACLDLAEKHFGVVMPGYTHLQPAQPVLFAHHLLAYVAMLERDRGRLSDCRQRANVLPLGSGALAGTTFPIDRRFVAEQLGFPRLSDNSLDAVSDRDHVAEFLAAGAILGMHLSRLAEELVLWSSQEFRFIELPDAFSTGSSIMPQKKNPDVAELVRGKSGRLYGNLVALLTVMKGLPLTYNGDMQEDKVALFDSADTIVATLELLAELLPRLNVNRERMGAAAAAGYTLATELADYLAAKGVPFREAHAIVAAIVRAAILGQRRLEDFSLEELRRFSPVFEPEVRRWISVEAAVRRRRVPGGTAPAEVRKQLRGWRRRIERRNERERPEQSRRDERRK